MKFAANPTALAACALLVTACVPATHSYAGPAVRARTVRDSGTLRFGGRIRTYVLHIPSRLKSAPALVVNLHGGGGTAAGQQRVSGYDMVADANGFLVVYPQGTDENWADGRGADRPDRTGVNDVGFISALIDKLIGEYHVDPRRVFATGLSNGAFMSQRLGCDLSNKIAAIAPVAGTLGVGVRCAPTKPVSVMEVHGTKDPIVPFNGGTMIGRGGQSTIISVEAAVSMWQTIDKCPTTAAVTTLPNNGDGTSVTKTTRSGCAQRSAVTLYTVTNGGHTWPDGLQYLPARIIGLTTTQFSASRASWDFFRVHPR